LIYRPVSLTRSTIRKILCAGRPFTLPAAALSSCVYNTVRGIMKKSISIPDASEDSGKFPQWHPSMEGYDEVPGRNHPARHCTNIDVARPLYPLEVSGVIVVPIRYQSASSTIPHLMRRNSAINFIGEVYSTCQNRLPGNPWGQWGNCCLRNHLPRAYTCRRRPHRMLSAGSRHQHCRQLWGIRNWST
jgi:hypothetical protein